MEERIIDDEELRKIKLTRKNGGTDAEDELAPDAEAEETEALLDLPEEYDEDLVGLTPTQLREELERREKAKEKAREEREKLLSLGRELLAAEKFEEAEGPLSQAALYEDEDGAAGKLLWQARTRGYSSIECFFEEEPSEEFAAASEEVRTSVLDVLGREMQTALEEAEAEAKPVRTRVEEATEKRRGAFKANRNYYLVRFLAVLGAIVLAAIGCGVSAYFITRRQSMLPLGFTIAFGAVLLVLFVFFFVFSHKLYVSERFVRSNEKLSSTEDGRTLAALDKKIGCLKTALLQENDD